MFVPSPYQGEVLVPQSQFAKSEPRIYFFDNLKAILITLVVFGHVIEPMLEEQAATIAYAFIYLFHMPLFIFCSGFFAKYTPKKIFTRLVIPYIIFQLIYTFLARGIWDDTDRLIQFTTPYWILWYLLALMVWTLLLPLLDILISNKRNMILTIIASLILGVAAGFEYTMGYYMSLSRLVVFAPFFIIGRCIGKTVSPETFQRRISAWYIKCVTGILSALIFVWLFFNYDTLDVRWFYGALAYVRLDYTYIVRILNYLAAFVISLFFLSIIPRRKMFFSYIGQRTMAVFLLHGIVMRLMVHYDVYTALYEETRGTEAWMLFASFLFSILLVVLFSLNFKRLVPFRRKTSKEKLNCTSAA